MASEELRKGQRVRFIGPAGDLDVYELYISKEGVVETIRDEGLMPVEVRLDSGELLYAKRSEVEAI